MKIGVCITTTPDRSELFEVCWNLWNKYAPKDAIVTCAQDLDGAGVARSKNASLMLLEKLGATHYFLVDDDTVPLKENWWKPFVYSQENHLLYNFPLKSKGKDDMRVLYKDEKVTAYSHTRGCFIYVTQKVLDTVGGFDTRYYNSLEHADYTTRIHNAGLTTHRSMTPNGADKLLYCLDQDEKTESSIKNAKPNYTLYRNSKKSKEYMPYK